MNGWVYLCAMRKLSMDELGRLSVDAFKQTPKKPVMMVLDNIRSMHNVGSVFRTADAFLAEGICLCGYTPQPPHRDIHKTALGATETVDWIYFPTTLEAVKALKERGYEVEGVDSEVLKLCDGCIEIPQLGMKHSLNISVAAGIVLWEIVREKIKSK